MNPIFGLGVMLLSGVVGYLVTRWHLSRGERTVSKDALLVDAFDDGYLKGFLAEGGSFETQDEEKFERYVRDRKRWVR